MRFTVATLADVDGIVPMMEAFNRFEEIEWTRARGEPALRRLLGDGTLGMLGLIDEGTKEERSAALGYFVLTWGFDLEWNGRDAFLTELWLEPQARGKGLGREALALVEKAARENGAQALHLMVRHENEVARRLYDRAGFRSPPRAFLTKTLP
jgi:ribosomal protein S18 acetylase RimI-like enzyme